MASYPHHLVKMMCLDDGTRVTLRPIRPADADIEQQFVRTLSDATRFFRFMDMLRELSPQMLRQMTDIDYHDQMALVATTTINGKETQIAVARYVTLADGENCEFAIVVGDDWQRKGVATALMELLIGAARGRGVKNMFGEVLASNSKMLRFVARLGFHSAVDEHDPGLMRVTRALGRQPV